MACYALQALEKRLPFRSLFQYFCLNLIQPFLSKKHGDFNKKRWNSKHATADCFCSVLHQYRFDSWVLRPLEDCYPS